MTEQTENTRESIADTNVCPSCKGDVTDNLHGLQYEPGHPEEYDGISEWHCPYCGYREGRWTHQELLEGQSEPRFGFR